MSVKSLLLRPLEALAGREYPDIHQLRQDASEDGVSESELDMSVRYARNKFVTAFVNMEGLDKFLNKSNEEQV